MRSFLQAIKKAALPDPWSAGYFKVPLKDLGDSDERFRCIWTPEPEIGAEKIGISPQFLANAEIYDQKYKHSEHMVDILERAFAAVRFSAKSNSDVLDIGTGSGKNSLLPMMQIFDNARFVATDLSPDLLAILQSYSTQQGLTDRISCVCTDAMNSFFVPKSFDVVAGVAILHHLIDPMLAIEAAFTALKDGGVAVFYDPFEGFALLGLTFKTILARCKQESLALDDDVATFLRAMVTDLDARRGTDKSADRFKHMDDKWLFTRNYFDEAAQAIGFSEVKIIARINHDSCFREYVTDLLRLGCGKTPDALASWAWESIDLLDQSFSAEMKSDLVMEGAIIFKK